MTYVGREPIDLTINPPRTKGMFFPAMRTTKDPREAMMKPITVTFFFPNFLTRGHNRKIPKPMGPCPITFTRICFIAPSCTESARTQLQ